MKRLLLAFVATGTAVVPASAQRPERETRLGSRIPVEWEVQSEETARTRKVQWRFGNCVIEKHRQAAVQYVLEYPAPGGYDRDRKNLIKKVADPDCLVKAASAFGGVRMELPGDTLRYALADALVRGELRAKPIVDVGRIPRLQHPLFNEADYQPKPRRKVSRWKLQELAAQRSVELGRIYLSEFGECAVRSDPLKARELLLTDPASPEEHAVFRQLSPILGKCVDAGRSLALNKMAIRGAIAFNYYRLSKAPRQPQSLTATK